MVNPIRMFRKGLEQATMRQKILFLKRFSLELLYVQGQYRNSFRGFFLLWPRLRVGIGDALTMISRKKNKNHYRQRSRKTTDQLLVLVMQRQCTCWPMKTSHATYAQKQVADPNPEADAWFLETRRDRNKSRRTRTKDHESFSYKWLARINFHISINPRF